MPDNYPNANIYKGQYPRYEGDDPAAVTTLAPRAIMEPPEHNLVVVAILIALIAILCLILGFVAIPPIIRLVQRQMPVPQKRMDRRYATIDGWLITKKVQPHDDACGCVQEAYGVKDAVGENGRPVPKQRATPRGPKSGNPLTSTQSTDNHKNGEPTAAPESSVRVAVLTAAMLLAKLAPIADEHLEDSSKVKADVEPSHKRNNKGNKKQKTEAKDPTAAETTETTPAAATTNCHGQKCGGCGTECKSGHCQNRNDTGSMEIHDDEEEPSCPICLEVFQVDDQVSWSCNESCDHVFHHACIREWLLRKVACPCCRQVLLPVDQPLAPPSETSSTTSTAVRQKMTINELSDLARDRAARTTTTYYCIEEGLVTLREYGASPLYHTMDQPGGEGKANIINGCSRPSWRKLLPRSRRTAGDILPLTRTDTGSTTPPRSASLQVTDSSLVGDETSNNNSSRSSSGDGSVIHLASSSVEGTTQVEESLAIDLGAPAEVDSYSTCSSDVVIEA